MNNDRQPASRFVRWLPKLLVGFAIWALLDLLFGSTAWMAAITDFLISWVVPLPFLGLFSIVSSLILAGALERRKRAAYWLMVALVITPLLLCVAMLYLLVGEGGLGLPDGGLMSQLAWQIYVQIALCLAVLVALIVHRKEYSARTRPGNAARAVVCLLVGFALTLLVGTVVEFAVQGIGWEQFVEVLSQLTLTGDSDAAPWLVSISSWGFTISLIVALWMLLRSQRAAAHLSIADEQRVRQLIALNPDDSLAYFATRRDKSVVLTEHAGVAYRVQAGVCLASGDPLGPMEHWPGAVKAFLDRCTAFGWVPAVISASQAAGRVYRDAGLRVLRIGDEAIVSANRFSLTNSPEVRRAVTRLHTLGYRVTIRRHGSVPPAELAEVERLATAWRAGDEERGFSMALGRLGDPADAECLLVEAFFPADHPAAGAPAGLLSFAPWGRDGASLDLMRRHPDADHGITELMIATLLTTGPEQGVQRVSLNFAVFRSAFAQGAELGAGPMSRAWRKVLLFASRWWQLESLYRSNSKYDPHWKPRMLCYPDSSDLAKVGLAAGMAEGFVDVPGWLGGGDTEQPILTAEQAAPLLAIEPATEPPAQRVPEQVQGRLDRREALLAEGSAPYAESVEVTAQCADASDEAALAGRVMAMRDHGGVVFATLRDFSGDIQLLLDRSTSAHFERFSQVVQLGDLVAARGVVGASRTGTRSLLVADWQLTAKALRPLPDKYHGIRDAETLVRQRYLDLIVNDAPRTMLRLRSAVFRSVRETLQGRGYLEVETPILQPIHGGANARPFITRSNAYNVDLYLRIAPELYLKRLLVGGVERVFEMGRNFRNEGADATHNPEFSMLEAYQAHANYRVMEEVMRSMVVGAANAALGGTVVTGRVQADEHEVDLGQPWRRVTVLDAISEALGEHVTVDTSVAELRSIADRLHIGWDPRWGWGALVTELYEHLCEATTVAPTFYCDFPAETSPLTSPRADEPRLAERWDLVAFGAEIGTAYSELIDPVIQRARLTAQSLAAAGGDPEAMELDEDFLQALEYGMPPTGALGMGLDRLVMMLTDSSIRQTIAFPLVKPR